MDFSKIKNVGFANKFERYGRITEYIYNKCFLKIRFFFIRHLHVLTDDISDSKIYKKMISKI